MDFSFLCNNKYAKWYITLIQSKQNRNTLLEGYTEKHHIKPKSFGGEDTPENIVELTAKEHYIAHLLLCKATNHDKRMIKAFHMMCFSKSNLQNRDYKIFSRTYDYLRREHGKIVSTYSKDTVTCFDNVEEIWLRVPKDLFYNEPERYSAPNKGIIRNSKSIIKQEETKFPFIVTIKDKVYTNASDLKKDYHFAGSNFIKRIFDKSFNLNRITQSTKNRYVNLIGNIEDNDSIYFVKQIYNSINVQLKPNFDNYVIEYKTLKIPKASSNKSNESRTRIIYYTPKGIYTRTQDFFDNYPDFSHDKIRTILNNKNSKIGKRQIYSFNGLLSEKDIGKTWKELGFIFKPKNNTIGSASSE